MSEVDYLIIGAGASGIACAWKLTENGKNSILILEARDRIGGRIWTKDIEIEGRTFAIDLGASFIHSKNTNAIVKIFKQRNIPLDTVECDEDNVSVLHLPPGYTEKQYDRFYAKVERFLWEDRENWMKDKKNKDESLADVIANWKKSFCKNETEAFLVDHVIEELIGSDYGASLTKLSAWYFDQDAEFDGIDCFPKGGYLNVISNFTTGLNFRLNSVVSEINYSQANHAAAVTLRSGEVFYARKAVIVTIPLGVLKSDTVNFVPDLPNEKKNAIRRLHVGNLNKVYFAFSQPFWDTSVTFFENLSRKSGLKCGHVYNLFHVYNYPILLFFYGGEYSLEMEATPEQQRKTHFLDLLSDFFQMPSLPEPSWFYCSAWDNEEYSLGAYSCIPPFASPRDMKALAKPIENKVFFAGEATNSTQVATVHGAFSSGLTVADALLQAK